MQFTFRTITQGSASTVSTEHPSILQFHNFFRCKFENEYMNDIYSGIRQKMKEFNSNEELYLLMCSRGLLCYVPGQNDLAFRMRHGNQILMKTQDQRQNNYCYDMEKSLQFTLDETKLILKPIFNMIDELSSMISNLKINASQMQQYNKQGIERATISNITSLCTLVVIYQLFNNETPSKFMLWLRSQKGTFISLLESEPSNANYYEIACGKKIFNEFWKTENVNGFQLVKMIPRVIMAINDNLNNYGGVYIRRLVLSGNVLNTPVQLLDKLTSNPDVYPNAENVSIKDDNYSF